MSDDQPVTGSILAARDCGALVLVYVSTDDGRTVPIPLGYRAFGWLLEAEGCRPDELVGRGRIADSGLGRLAHRRPGAARASRTGSLGRGRRERSLSKRDTRCRCGYLLCSAGKRFATSGIQRC